MLWLLGRGRLELERHIGSWNCPRWLGTFTPWKHAWVSSISETTPEVQIVLDELGHLHGRNRHGITHVKLDFGNSLGVLGDTRSSAYYGVVISSRYPFASNENERSYLSIELQSQLHRYEYKTTRRISRRPSQPAIRHDNQKNHPRISRLRPIVLDQPS